MANNPTNVIGNIPLPPTDDVKVLKERLQEKEKMIKQLAWMIKDKENAYNELNEQLQSKDKECASLTQKIKSLEKKTEEVYKTCSKGNVSEIGEIKKQSDKEKLILNEVIKTYSMDLEEKKNLISTIKEELTTVSGYLEEERKKNEACLKFNSSKYDTKSQELEFHKISSENSSLKSKLGNSEEKIEKLLEQIEKMKNDKEELDQTYRNNIDQVKKELALKENSYKTLIKDYQNTIAILSNTQDNLEKATFFKNKSQFDLEELDKKFRTVEKEAIEAKAENEGFKTRIKGYEVEVEIMRKKIKEYEAKLAEFKLSKQVFPVSYYYMKMAVQGHIIMQREGDLFSLVIENRSATRIFSFLEVELRKETTDANKIVVKFVKDNAEEEYFTNDAGKLLDTFNEFKKRVIEITDFSYINKTEKKETEKKVKKTEEKLKNFFEF